MPFGKLSLVLRVEAFFGRYSDSLKSHTCGTTFAIQTLLNYLVNFGEDNIAFTA